jgi:hypothetical protein
MDIYSKKHLLVIFLNIRLMTGLNNEKDYTVSRWISTRL